MFEHHITDFHDNEVQQGEPLRIMKVSRPRREEVAIGTDYTPSLEKKVFHT